MNNKLNVLNTSDWHFQEKDHDEILKCCEFILEYARKNKPDLIVHSGDITHSEHLKLDTKSAKSIFRLFKEFSDIAPVAVVTGTKSHDGKASLALSSISGKYPILVSDYPEQLTYSENNGFHSDEFGVSENPDFIITQIPQPTKQYFVNNMSIESTEKELSGALSGMFVNLGENASKFNCPHIVNMHVQVGGCYISETQQLIGRDIEVSKAQLKMLNADLICLGHIHKYQGIDDNAFYPGSPTRMNFGETEKKGFYVFDFEDKILMKYKFHETPARQMLSIKYDFTKDGNSIDMFGFMIEEYTDDELKNTYIKIVLTVWQDEAKHINKAHIEKFFFSAGAKSVTVSTMRKPRETVRSEKVCEAEGLRDKFRAMAELRGEKINESVIFKTGYLEAGIPNYEKQYNEILEASA